MAKIRRRKIFVDFEWHIISSDFAEKFNISGAEIIEFGAVMLNPQNEEIGSFKSYVKPRYVDKLTERIKSLTGISDELLEDAPDFADVLNEFISWCEADDEMYEIYSWSESDLNQIKIEMHMKNIPVAASTKYMIKNWFDMQHKFDSTLGFDRQLSLTNALYTAGIDAVGDAHDALDDARNTAILYKFLSNPEKQQTTIKTIQSALNPKESVTTLGEMVDWSKLF